MNILHCFVNMHVNGKGASVTNLHSRLELIKTISLKGILRLGETTNEIYLKKLFVIHAQR